MQTPQYRVALALEGIRLADLVALTKPGLTLMAVATAAGGAMLALERGASLVPVLHVILGTTSVGAGAAALNQHVERHYDALMKRTEGRPLPSGRVSPRTALAAGLMLAIAGLAYLASTATVLATGLAAASLASYLLLYTPLKRITPLATVVGGIPGALPPLIGWAAVRGELSPGAWSLFLVLFFWQMPHFLALAWMYRRDYERGGYRTLPSVDPTGILTGSQVVLYATGLLLASVLPSFQGMLGAHYLVGSGLLSLAFLVVSVRFALFRTNSAARALFLASLFYLPALVVLMLLDRY